MTYNIVSVPCVPLVSRSQTHPYRRRVWTTVNTKLGSGFHQILGALVGLSRCYVNNHPLMPTLVQPTCGYAQLNNKGKSRSWPPRLTSIQSSYVEQRSVSAAIAAAVERISVVLKDKQLEALLPHKFA